MYQSNDGGESWEEESLAVGTGNAMVIHTALSEEGGFAYTAMTETDGFEVFCPSSEYGTMPSIKSGGFVMTLGFGQDGILYAAQDEAGVSSISAVDSKTGEVRLLTKTAGTVYQIAAFENILYLRENERIEMYDLTAGEMQEDVQVLNDFAKRYPEDRSFIDAGNRLYLLPDEDGIYMGCGKGLFYYRSGGQAAEQLIDGDMSYFGKLDIRILGMAKTGEETFLVLFSDGKLEYFDCSAEGEQVYNHVLKIFSVEESGQAKAAVEAFKKEHPDVLVKYEYGLIEGSALTRQDVVKNLNAELMSDKGPDVILMDGMDAEAYTKKGLLLDLSKTLEEVSQEERLLTNVTESCRTQEEAVYVIPTRFLVPVLAGKKEEINEIDSLETLADGMEKIRETVPEGPLLETYSGANTVRLLALSGAGEWVKDGKLQEENVASFLDVAKRIYETEISGIEEDERQEMLGVVVDDWGLTAADDWTMDVGFKKALFVNNEGLMAGIVRDFTGLGNLLSYLGMHEEMNLQEMPGQSGSCLISTMPVSVSSKTKEKELAESFVKILLSEKVQQYEKTKSYDTLEGLPVNKEALEAMLQAVCSDIWSFGVVKADGPFENPSPEDTEIFYGIVQQSECTAPPDRQVLEVVMKYGGQVLEDQISLEEGMAEIRKNISIYLAE